MTAADPTKTAPWSSDTNDLLTRSLTHVVTARAVLSGVTRRNVVTNPNLETAATGWAATTGTFARDTAAPIDGTASAKVTGAGSTAIGLEYHRTFTQDRTRVEAGVAVDVSLRLKVSVASTQLRFDVEWFDDNGAAVGAVVTGPTSTPAANTPVTLVGTFTAPSRATRIRVAARTVPNVAAGVALWADSLMVGTGLFDPPDPTGPGTYFDGNTAATGAYAYAWEGATNASTSIEYRADTVVPLDVEAVTVGWDETRAPRVAASLTCRIPTNQGTLDLLDPRTGIRVEITAGYRRPDGTVDAQLLADLVLRDRVVTRPDNRMTLRAASDESLLIDNASTPTGIVGANTTANAISAVISQALPAQPPTITATAGAAVSGVIFTDRWDAVDDLADRVSAQVYDNGLRAWFIAPMPVLTTAAPALVLAVGSGGTVIASDTGLTRDEDFANAVVLVYNWRDAADVEKVIRSRARVATGPYASVGGNVKTLVLDREVATTQAEANTAATSLVKRTVTRGRSFGLDTVAAYWLRPGHTVEVTLPLGPAESHLVTAVEFDPVAGSMHVTTRLPDGDYTIGA